MENAGSALMGIGFGTGEERAVEAAKAAIASPLLEMDVEGARGILFNVTGGSDLSMFEVDEAAKIITEAADPEATIIFGAVINENYTGEVKITVVATGFDEAAKKRKLQQKGFHAQSLNNQNHTQNSSSHTQNDSSGHQDQLLNFGPSKGSSIAPKPEDELDIPAFIRNNMKKN